MKVLHISRESTTEAQQDGLAESPHSLLAHRLMAEYYQHLEEYEVAVDISRKSQRLVATMVEDTGLKLEKLARHAC